MSTKVHLTRIEYKMYARVVIMQSHNITYHTCLIFTINGIYRIFVNDTVVTNVTNVSGLPEIDFIVQPIYSQVLLVDESNFLRSTLEIFLIESNCKLVFFLYK